jgi:transcription antitermination factor NusG
MLKASQEPPMLPPGVPSTEQLSGRWWVGHTRSRFEKAFARELLARGVGYFLPLVERARVCGGKTRRILLPLFPSYVFFCGPEESRRIAMETNRLCRTIEVSDQETLRSQCAAIERALARGARLEPSGRLAPGRRCRVTAGPFRGVEGTVIRGNGRTSIVLEISALGVGASLDVEPDFLEPIEGAGSARGPRPAPQAQSRAWSSV